MRCINSWLTVDFKFQILAFVSFLLLFFSIRLLAVRTAGRFFERTFNIACIQISEL